MVDVLLGLQWGDEGKGKIVDFLANQYDLVARFQGGPNAGHTLYLNGKKFVLHTIPSGIFRENLQNLIGNGVVLDPITLEKEILHLRSTEISFEDRLFIAKKAHLILPTHRLLDAASEASKGQSKIGSTLRGIGPTYMDKTGRNGLRVGDILLPNFKEKYLSLKEKHLNLAKLYTAVDFDLENEEKKWFAAIDFLKTLQIVDGEYFVNNFIKKGRRVLAEGAQGSMLDIDFGTYPFVTSSNTTASGVCNGLGIAPRHIGEVIGISKAYCTRVGSGAFPTELHDEIGEKLRKEGKKFGATTGRPRRCGWIDIPQLKYTCMLSGVTQICITKTDILNTFEDICAATLYDYDGMETDILPYDLQEVKLTPIYTHYKGWNSSLEGIADFQESPEALKNYLNDIEMRLQVPIKMVSVGPEREQLLIRETGI